jgi:hypothetical protein
VRLEWPAYLPFSPREFVLPLGDPRIWRYSCSQAYWDKLDPNAHKKVSCPRNSSDEAAAAGSSYSCSQAYWNKLDPNAHKKVRSFTTAEMI